MKSRSLMQHLSRVKLVAPATTGAQIHFLAIESEENDIETFLNLICLNVATERDERKSVVDVSFKDSLKLRNERSASWMDADQAHDLHTDLHILTSDTDSRSKMFINIS